MGWYTDTKKSVVRNARKAGRFAQRNAGRAARDAAVLGAGIAGTATCGPLCGVAAAVALDEALGGPIERNVERAISGAGAQASEWLDYSGDGPPPPRPDSAPAAVSGRYEPFGRVRGEFERPESRWAGAARIGAVVVVVAGTAIAGYYLVARERGK